MAEFNIEIESRHGFQVIIEAENVKIVEDVEYREYLKDEDGNIKYSCPKRDIKTDFLNQIIKVLDDAIYYRVDEFNDSQDLIKSLIDKMSEDKREEFLKELKEIY